MHGFRGIVHCSSTGAGAVQRVECHVACSYLLSCRQVAACDTLVQWLRFTEQ